MNNFSEGTRDNHRRNSPSQQTVNAHSDHVLLHQQQGGVTVAAIADRRQTAMGVLRRHGRTLAVRLAVVQLEGLLRTVTDRETGHQLRDRLVVGRVGRLTLATNQTLVLGEPPFPQLAALV